MMSLALARSWYLVIGIATILVSVGSLGGMTTPGATLDVGTPIGGFGLGLLSLAAAVFLPARDGIRAALTWIGVMLVATVFALLLRHAWDTARDALVYALIPAVIAFAAAARMAAELIRRRSVTDPAVASSPEVG